MKIVRTFAMRVYTETLHLVYKFSSLQGFRKNENSVLILPPDDSGSLGDEAMTTAVIEFYKSINSGQITILLRNSENEPDYLKSLFSNVKYVRFRNSFQFANLVKDYYQFCCLGADMMDGYYGNGATLHILRLASIASRLGVKTSILGFSFNSKPTQESIDSLKKLPSDVRLCLRDPVSFGRIKNLNIQNIHLVADLAFLLRPDRSSSNIRSVLEWIESRKKSGHLIIGVNANYRHVTTLQLSGSAELAKSYSDAIVEIKKNFKIISFVLCPHDFRELDGEMSDDSLAQLIYDLLPDELKSSCLKLQQPLMAGEMKAICKELDVVISGRMHLAIACLGQGTPPVCITYQGKFEGLFEHFELTGMTIAPQEAIHPYKLSKFVSSIIEKREALREKIVQKLPRIQELSRNNFR